MKIAIYGSRRQEPYLDAIAEFLNSLARKHIDVVMHAKLHSYLLPLLPEAIGAVSEVTDSPCFSADLAVSIGGDGTFLRTAAWVADKEIPVLGVNTGHLGYLSAIGVDELPSVIDALADDDFIIESRSLIEVVEPEIPCWPFALNEVALAKEDSASMITASTMLDGTLLADYRADGLIVSTPTGSTAYNLSAGGPIVEPTAPVWVLSPIAAHSLSMRPLVVGDSSLLDIRPRSRSRNVRLAVDGRSTVLPSDTRVVLRKATFGVRIIRRRSHGFQHTLRDKLSWG